MRKSPNRRGKTRKKPWKKHAPENKMRGNAVFNKRFDSVKDEVGKE